MAVEEDPSSQFVDFTNATALEQFVSDAEQTLIAWHLAGKGHAAAEALAAAHGDASSSADGPTCYTRVLEFEQPPRKPDGSMASASGATHKVKYALTLFLARAASAEPATTARESDVGGKKQKWQQGREHFTPTMLAIADAKRDIGVWSQGDKPGERNTTAWDAGGSGLSASAIAANAERWFGVDEFLLVTRTSLPSERENRLQQQKQQQALTRRASRNSLLKDGKVVGDEPVQDPAVRRDSATTTGSAFDGTMDTNEANLLLSAIHLALLNCNCTIPAFVPIQYVARGTWLGTAVPGSTGNVSITFDTDSTPEANSNQSSISGLLDFFQLKLQLPPHVEDSCRLAGGGDAENLSVGTWVSAAFRYSWRRDEDPREDEKQPLEWRYGGASGQLDQPSSESKLLRQALFGLAANREHFWGSASNPVAGLELTAIWPNLKEGTYVDNAVHSTLDPESAPQWMIDVQFDTKSVDWLRGLHDNARKPTVPLSRVVANLVHAYANAREISRDVLVSELAPTVTSPPPSSSVSIPLPPPPSSSSDTQTPSSRLSGTIPAARAAAVFGNAIGSITSTIVSAATWKGADVEEIQRTVAEIFDHPENELAATSGSLSAMRSIPSSIIHSAPVGELVSVLACRMGQLHGLSAMSLLWVEFVKALRERWFQQRLLPLLSTQDNLTDDKYDESASRTLDALFLLDSASVSLPDPDFRQCLLHQKLQLLNACILRQADGVKSSLDTVDASSLRRSLSASTTHHAGARMSDLTAFAFDEDDDDEFFDSVEVQDSVSSSRSPVLSSLGVRKPLPGMTSLLSGQPLMEPITQAAVPLTEDIAKQQQDLLSRLGVGHESTVLRQQLQSAALVSDMQAFKAANPGSCLADFIRWYSPKDWIPADPLSVSVYASLPQEGKNVWWFDEKGMLSERMRSTSGSHGASSLHAWHQMWESSAPVPVSKQKRLFDPVGESEKLYHYLETIAPHEMFHQMLVGAIASCYSMLERACLPSRIRIPIVEDALKDLQTQCDRAVSLLDDAYAESQVAYPTGRDQKGEQEKAKSQLQVAFEMALDACRAMTRTFEQVELMMSQASALLHYFTTEVKGKPKLHPRAIQLVASLLSVAHQRVPSGLIASTRRSISELLEDQSLRSRIAALVLHNPASRDPVHREYVIRCICPRPFLDDSGDFSEPELDHDKHDSSTKQQQSAAQDESAILDLLEDSPVVVNRMYACFTKETVRFALTLAESEF